MLKKPDLLIFSVAILLSLVGVPAQAQDNRLTILCTPAEAEIVIPERFSHNDP
jgi:hypothetical protein